MEAPNFADMPAEDLLTLIEEAQTTLDQKIATEKSDIEERLAKLARLEARRAGKDMKPKGKPTVAPKPRGRPAHAPKPAEAAEQAPAVASAA